MIKVLLLDQGALGQADPAVVTLLRDAGSQVLVVALAPDPKASHLPDPDTFSRAALRHGVMLSEIAYVDGSPAGIAAAEVLGIRSHHFVGAEPLRAFLTDVLDGTSAQVPHTSA